MKNGLLPYKTSIFVVLYTWESLFSPQLPLIFWQRARFSYSFYI